MDCNEIRNEFRIVHGGTAQGERPPFGLHPDYVKVDERNYADWVVFARSYAQFLQYYNLANTPSGDWTPFWSINPAIVLANLAAARADWFREETRLIFIELQKLDNQANEPLLKQHFNRLFDAVATLAWQLDRHITKLPDDLIVKTSLRNLIKTNLAPAFRNWIAWHKQAASLTAPFPLLDAGDNLLVARVKAMRVLGEPIESLDSIITTHTFSNDWITDASPDWNTFVAGITADASVFGTPPLVNDAPGHLNFAIRHFFFTNAFEQFLKVFAKAAQEATVALELLLSHWNLHEPHFALYLSFLRLFAHERDYLNTLTDRHLHFYYNRVLRLKENGPVPAQAFVTFELAKHVDAKLLLKNTVLKAGKDALGKEVFFHLTDDFVPNKAKVTDLKCILKAPLNPALYQFNNDVPIYKTDDINRYFAAPIANSADGLGAKLTSSDGQWHPFGNKTAINKQWNMDIPGAEIGFAVASNYLYLTEAERTITLTVKGISGGTLSGVQFRVLLTTKKGWHETTATVNAGNQLIINLTGADPAIVPYNAKVHGGSYQTTFPALKCLLPNQTGSAYDYEKVKRLSATSLALRVDVTGKKTMAFSGSTGPLDGGKPFHPFGPSPSHKAVFFMGDKEVFQKASNVRLTAAWKEIYYPSSPASDYPYFHQHAHGHPSADFFQLQQGAWQPDSAGELLPLNNIDTNTAFSVAAINQIAPDFTENIFYTNGDVAGFAKFELNGDWGHSLYPNALAAYARNGGTIPNRLYDPQILAVSLDYDATTEIPLAGSAAYNNQTGRLFHIQPFGFELITPGPGATALLPFIVPQYNGADGNSIGNDGGEWYIGIKDLAPPQTISLLVQVAEGSADPLAEKPDNHLKWAYLQDNQWVAFTKDAIADGTNGLLQSGLIRFSVPAAASSDNTILPGGLHWIRISVETAVDTVCRIVGVHAQGTRAELNDNSNDPALNALPLPAGTINKLRESDSAVKKTEQPYATFGGKPAETGPHFFTRISERLRHKHRAIALWDYEHIILEEFPNTHKVKCLNHLQFEQIGGQGIYRELAPGHVTVIIVSNVRNKNAVNPLRPYTSLGDLKNIEAFLKRYTTCFAKLHVKNPIFEPVKAYFDVKFFPGYDETFYEKLLSDEIVRFLSPWAFDEGREIGFGGKMYKSVLINFVEERPYVDYVENFRLIHLTEPPKPDQEVIEPTKLCSILVSADRHDIKVIPDIPALQTAEDCGCAAPVVAARPKRFTPVTGPLISTTKPG